MRHRPAILTITIVVLMLFGAVAEAGPFEDGAAALERGDDTTAVRIWRELAIQGNADAQHALGLMYQVGLGVAQNNAEAVKWYRLAANQGLAKAEDRMGQMYHFGLGVAQNYKTAFDWYTRAVEQGEVSAAFYLGDLYYKGQGVVRDYKTAATLFGWAAKRGNGSAQFALGSMYFLGEGVPQDYVHAHMWFNLAAAALVGKKAEYAEENSKSAASNRDLLTNKMTPEQIGQAQELARKCQASNFQECD